MSPCEKLIQFLSFKGSSRYPVIVLKVGKIPEIDGKSHVDFQDVMSDLDYEHIKKFACSEIDVNCIFGSDILILSKGPI